LHDSALDAAPQFERPLCWLGQGQTSFSLIARLARGRSSSNLLEESVVPHDSAI
jgi:hypothetical protein